MRGGRRSRHRCALDRGAVRLCGNRSRGLVDLGDASAAKQARPRAPGRRGPCTPIVIDGSGLADTDGDGLPDGLERGLAAPEAKDSKPTAFLADADPSTRSDPLDGDSDDDGLTDGAEDADRKGSVGPHEPDPNQFATDGDGISTGQSTGSPRGPTAPINPWPISSPTRVQVPRPTPPTRTPTTTA